MLLCQINIILYILTGAGSIARRESCSNDCIRDIVSYFMVPLIIVIIFSAISFLLFIYRLQYVCHVNSIKGQNTQ
jgi:type III secretory pathway component EscU